MDALRRVRVRFSGRVQGVGFRATVRSLARQSQSVTGWVRNDADGAVTMEAQGRDSRVSALLDAIRREMASNIRHCEVSDLPPQSGEVGFDIRY
ncbi:MAG: acylphosphatase [Phycisphaerales bacterium]|nr:acylphosphatase [Phycisphaerales bacterium]